MKWLSVFALLLASVLMFEPPEASADVNIDVSFFHNRLAAHGSWVQHARHQWVWQPRLDVVGSSWRPYSRGHWVWTDEGWYWDSDFDWGWAPFHYGRWDRTPELGWFWVPGYDWAPAWVAWRRGGDVVGWAPLPPEVGFSASAGLIWNNFDVDGPVFRSRWLFVPERSFLSRRLVDRVAGPSRNGFYMSSTVRLGSGILVRDRRVVNVGLPIESLRTTTGLALAPVRLRVSTTAGAESLVARNAREVGVYRPTVARTAVVAVPPSRSDGDRAHAGRLQRLQEHQAGEVARLAERHRVELGAANRGAAVQARHVAEVRVLRQSHGTQRAALDRRRRR